MNRDDEIKSIREELDDLLFRASALSKRLNAIERETRLERMTRELSAAEATGPVTPTAVPTAPPPLPPEAFAPPSKPREVAPVVFSADSSGVGVGPGQEPVKELVYPVFSALEMAEKGKPAQSLEMRLGTYWLPRLGVVILALGVGWLMVLAAQYSTPTTRVASGYLICAGLLGAGWWFEKRFLQFARVLYAGGIAASYFVTFAAHYIEQAKVIESTTLGVGALAAVVVIWTAIAQVRRSRIVAVLVTFLGHLTVFLAFFTAQDLARNAVFGIAVLSVGSAYFLLGNRWYYVATLGIAGSYVNHALWWSGLVATTPQADFQLSISTLAIYLLTFALAELLSPEDLRKSIPTWFRSAFVTANSAAFFVLATVMVNHYEHTRGHQHVLEFWFAVFLFAMTFAYLRLRRCDVLYNVYMTKAVSAATLALAVYYGHSSLTAWLAVEMVALLYMSRRSGLVVSRVLAFAVAGVAVAHGIWSILDRGTVAYSDPNYWRYVFQGGFSAVAFFAASQLYQRTDWTIRSPRTLPVAKDVLAFLWDLDLVADLPNGYEHRRRPVGGLQFPYLYAIGGTILFWPLVYTMAAEGHRLPVYAGFLLIATLLASALPSRPFGLVAMATLPLLFISGCSDIIDTIPAARDAGRFDALAIMAASLAVLMTAAVRADRHVVGERDGLRFHQMAPSPYLLYLTSAFLTGLLISMQVERELPVAVWLSAAAVAAAGLIQLLHPQALAACATGLLAWGGLAWATQSDEPATMSWHAVLWGIAALAIAADRYYSGSRARANLNAFGTAAIILAWLLLARYLTALGLDTWQEQYFASRPDPGFGYYRADWQNFWWCALSFAFAGYSLLTRSRSAFAVAVFGASIGSVTVLLESYDRALTNSALIATYVSLALFWMMCERLVQSGDGARPGKLARPVSGAVVAAACVLLLCMLERIPAVRESFLTVSWTFLAFGMFGVSLLTWQKYYRYAGLAVFFLAMGRAGVVDVMELSGLYRVGAFMVLGVVLLIVGGGYFKATELINAREAKDVKSEPPPARPQP
ncbi:MAG: hypothetical protein AMXMBFR4_02490 [Candidatus Hydrogenedentota bacterium]